MKKGLSVCFLIVFAFVLAFNSPVSAKKCSHKYGSIKEESKPKYYSIHEHIFKRYRVCSKCHNRKYESKARSAPHKHSAKDSYKYQYVNNSKCKKFQKYQCACGHTEYRVKGNVNHNTYIETKKVRGMGGKWVTQKKKRCRNCKYYIN